MNNTLFFGLIVLAAGVLVGWYVLRGQPQAPFGSNTKNTQRVTPTQKTDGNTGVDSVRPTGEAMEKGGAPARMVVTYTDTGFAPSPATVTKGTTVTFVNESSREMWVASDVHPTHQLLPGFDQKASVSAGGVYEYAFTKAGMWRYHNHMHVTDIATVKVTE